MDNDDSEFHPLEYPNAPGHRGVDTSVAVAIDLAPKLGRLQVMVLEAIRAVKEKGLTAKRFRRLAGRRPDLAMADMTDC